MKTRCRIGFDAYWQAWREEIDTLPTRWAGRVDAPVNERAAGRKLWDPIYEAHRKIDHAVADGLHAAAPGARIQERERDGVVGDEHLFRLRAFAEAFRDAPELEDRLAWMKSGHAAALLNAWPHG